MTGAFPAKLRSVCAGKSVHWIDFYSRFDASDNATNKRQALCQIIFSGTFVLLVLSHKQE
ncbi:hypothetical protein CES86_5437 [Brucella lupini]|uniref:Uncharacterized protein n=1 Tax=Brucella lupini TaxID=255457 RepID=A0A256H1R3_9HYPH|nr:hypothetical protein CES86_5437 [Brucella lupini]